MQINYVSSLNFYIILVSTDNSLEVSYELQSR